MTLRLSAVQAFLQRHFHCGSAHTSEHDWDSLHQLGTLMEDFTDVDNIQTTKSPSNCPDAWFNHDWNLLCCGFDLIPHFNI